MSKSTFEDVKDLLASADAVSRRKLVGELQEIIASTETAEETTYRFGFDSLRSVAAKMGQDLGVFDALGSSERRDVGELQQATNLQPPFIGSVLRYMASLNLIQEVAADVYAANQTSRNLASKESRITTTYFFHMMLPLFQFYANYLPKHKGENLLQAKRTIYQEQADTDLDTYTWFSQHEMEYNALFDWMLMERSFRDEWVGAYPIEAEAHGWTTELPLFVDIGGNRGSNCAMFKERFPNLPGRVILQDIPSNVAQALETPGVENIAHDFFQPQPIKGAKFYYLGWILHNWTDERAGQILANIRSAMTADSVLLINEMVVPEVGAPAFPAALDLVMLAVFRARERTLEQWKVLFEEAGLTMHHHEVYDRLHYNAIIGAKLK